MNVRPKKILSPWLLMVLLVLLLVGMFASRALLSIASAALVMGLLSRPSIVKDYRYAWAGITLLLLPVAVSGLWSSNTGEWWRAVTVRLPLVTVAAGMLAIPFTQKTGPRLALLLLALVWLGSLYSIGHYMINHQEILTGYLQARVMPTPLDNDHIRYSWLVVIALLLAWYSWPAFTQKWERCAAVVLSVWLIVFLHFMAAKTGLLCLYVAAGILGVQAIAQKKQQKMAGALLLAMLLVPVLAWLTMPSLRNRVQYVVYDFGNYSRGIFLPGSSDGNRVLSLRAGWHITRQHPLGGVGFGDLKQAVDAWHTTHQPGTPAIERFLPLNEWLIYSAGSGIVGMLCFSLGLMALLLPMGQRRQWAAIAVLLLPMVTDDTLESQFGVVIFTFAVCWLIKYTPRPHTV